MAEEEKKEQEQEQETTQETGNYQEQLLKSEYYKLADAYHIDLSGYKADSQESLDKVLEEIKAKTRELVCKPAFSLKDENGQDKTDKDGQPLMQGFDRSGLDDLLKKAESEEEKKKLEEAFKEITKPVKREDMTLEDADKGDQKDENQDLEWVAKKREIWKNFAKDVSKDVEEKEAVAPVQYSVGLKEVQGRVDYTSEKNAAITQDADFLLYKGLVRDAAKSNLNIKIGDTLTGAQKLMLYAAVLSSSETYPNGDKLSLIGAPQIDPQSPDYQSLPDDVKKILEKELKRQQEERQGQGQEQEQEQQQEQKPNEATEKEKIAAMAESLGITNLPENPEEALKQIDKGIKEAAEFAGFELEEMDTIDKRKVALKRISDQIISDLSEITGKPVTEVQSKLPLPRLMKDFEAHKALEARNLATLANDVGYKFDAEGKGTPLTQLKNMSLSDYKNVRKEIAKKAVENKGWDQKRDAVYGASLANAFNNARGGR